jgi:hypothetical protein
LADHRSIANLSASTKTFLPALGVYAWKESLATLIRTVARAGEITEPEFNLPQGFVSGLLQSMNLAMKVPAINEIRPTVSGCDAPTLYQSATI